MLVFRNDYDGGYIDSRMALLTNMILYHELNYKIKEAKDHEGSLTITWSKKPLMHEIELMNIAWQFLNENIVDHYYQDQLIYEHYI
jgi:hypothetical protein